LSVYTLPLATDSLGDLGGAHPCAGPRSCASLRTRQFEPNLLFLRMSDLVAPFAADGRFQSLILKATETCLLNDSAWACYETDRDAETLATKHAMFFRTVFTPTLASFLDAVRAGEPHASHHFANRLTSSLKCGLVNDPSHTNSLVQIVVVTKVR
jgi:hypothetical protein